MKWGDCGDEKRLHWEESPGSSRLGKGEPLL